MANSATSRLPLDSVRWILFDAVGTLIYPDPPVAEVYRGVARRFGLELSAAEIHDRFAAAFAHEFAAVGSERPPTSEASERARWQRVVAAVLHELAAPAEEPFDLLWAHFARADSWRTFEDVAPTLAKLARRGVRLGIASNFDGRLHGIVQATSPLAACERVFVSSEIGFSKPDRRFFQSVQRQLNVSPDEILLVGDDVQNDQQGALAAGWRTVLVRRGAPASGANISALSELLS